MKDVLKKAQEHIAALRKAGLNAEADRYEALAGDIKKSDKPNDCPDCDGHGRVYNNADPTSGQYVTCETCQPKGKIIEPPEAGYEDMFEKSEGGAKQYWVQFDQKPHKETSDYAAYHMSKDEIKQHLDNWDRKAKFSLSHETGRKVKEGQSHPTAITRNEAPKPIRDHLKEQPKGARGKKILYHGVGKDEAGVKALSQGGKHIVDKYDPYHPDEKVRRLPNKKYDEIHSHYTLNVVNSETGKGIMREIHDRLKPGGKAVISVRRDEGMKRPRKTRNLAKSSYDGSLALKDPAAHAMETEMAAHVDKGLSRVEAAKKVKATKPNWYWQTPEGEHLDAVINGSKK